MTTNQQDNEMVIMMTNFTIANYTASTGITPESTLPAENETNNDSIDKSHSAGYENLMLVNVEKFIVHENFTRTDFFRNDIALVK